MRGDSKPWPITKLKRTGWGKFRFAIYLTLSIINHLLNDKFYETDMYTYMQFGSGFLVTIYFQKKFGVANETISFFTWGNR